MCSFNPAIHASESACSSSEPCLSNLPGIQLRLFVNFKELGVAGLDAVPGGAKRLGVCGLLRLPSLLLGILLEVIVRDNGLLPDPSLVGGRERPDSVRCEGCSRGEGVVRIGGMESSEDEVNLCLCNFACAGAGCPCEMSWCCEAVLD